MVLVGAGHAHVAVLRSFAMLPVAGVRLTLITREVDTPYSGMLPGFVAGHYGFDDIHIDTGPLTRRAGGRLYQDEAIGLDIARRLVLCCDRPPVPYDLLSLDIGSRPNTSAIVGADSYAIPVKPIDGFLTRFEALRARVLTGASRHVLLVGGGAGGVELLLSVERRLRRDAGDRDLRFTLVSGGNDILPSFPAAFRTRFRAVFAARGIEIRSGAHVLAVDEGGVTLTDQKRIEADEVLWTTEAAPSRWLAETGLALDSGGFLRVDAGLHAIGHPEILAAGDMVSFDPGTIPRSGVYAVRAGPVLAANIRARLSGRQPRRYRPQRDALYLVSTGDTHAIGTRNGITFEGDWVWRLKDRIDRRFMARFNHLPPMPGDTDDMRCGGCGAKVGALVLSQALATLPRVARADVLVGFDAPDDAAVLDTGGPDLSVQTVDYFRSPIDDPYRFGMIAANHSLGDLYAMGAEPRTALAIVTLPHGPEDKLASDLAAMMQGANEILADAGCALVGGHTGEGAELALGFALTGRVGRRSFYRKSGMCPGDALILTKPIGTGTLLAADMRGQARARWVQAAIRHMTHSNRAAAEALVGFTVHAVTDVTGFGLLGHLLEMIKASGVGACIELDRIPILDGARETIARGIVSSMQSQNERSIGAVANLAQVRLLPLFPLLLDPQTAGGLLIALPLDEAGQYVVALHHAGYAHAAIIGAVTEGNSLTITPGT